MTEPADPAPLGPIAVAGVLVGMALLGLLSGIVDVLFVPLYVGSTPIGLAVVLAVVGNVVIPRIGYLLLDRIVGSVVAVVGWLVAVVGLSLPRPEGDVLLPGGTGGIVYVTYGVLLGGTLAAVVTVAMTGIWRAAARGPVDRRPRPGP